MAIARHPHQRRDGAGNPARPAAPGRIRLLASCRGGAGAAKRSRASRAEPGRAALAPRAPAASRGPDRSSAPSCRGRRNPELKTRISCGVPSDDSGTSAAAGKSRPAGSAMARRTRNGIPAAAARRATTALSRSTARAPVWAQRPLLVGPGCENRRRPEHRPFDCADRAREMGQAIAQAVRLRPAWVFETTLPDRITSPGRRFGARAPATPKLIRHDA